MAMRSSVRTFLALSLLLSLVLFGVVNMPARAQDPASAYTSYDDILYMMEQEKTLDQYISGAGALLPGEAQVSPVNQDDIGDRWMMRAAAGSLTVTVNFPSGMALEAALFDGTIPLPDNQGRTGFIPLNNGTPISFSLPEDHFYNLIIRKQHVADPAAGEYTVTAEYRSISRSLPEMRDNSTNQPMSRSRYRLTDEGIQLISLPSASVYVHAEGVSTAASHGGRAAQVRFNGRGTNYGVLINNWASEIAVLDGSLSVRGEVNGLPRLYYWENFNFNGDFLDGDLVNLVDGQRNNIQTDWQDIRGIWMMDDCLGVLFHDGHRFLTDLSGSRTAVLHGGLANFETRLSPLDGQANNRVLLLTWDGIPTEPLVTYFSNTLEVDYVGDRRLRVQSTDLRIARGNTPDVSPENQQLDITRNDSASSVTLDWINLRRFELTNDTALFEFMDEPRGVTTREAVNLERIEAIEDLILMTYKNTPDGQPGMQRLMLPRDESYLELITPAGVPTFDGRSLPGDAGYMPRALNNTGADCYPITTFMPEANCPAAGYPNPANGNLWYQVTDLTAYGHLLDLALTRNYNSRLAGVDGPFGLGWSTAALIDHRTLFDPAQSARVVAPEDTASYRIGLDLTWAPRGIVWFTTPTGSQHIFVSENNNGFTAGTLTSPSMPGWQLTHDALRGKYWVLTEDEGATFVFDRAGRLLEFGYPQEQRTITISYPEDIIPALENLQGAPMVLTDALGQRQLELYYDSDLHITRSVLRDLSQSSSSDTCDAGCLETRYTYANGLLTDVAYADGTTAHYTYEDTTRQMVAHEDPRAPIYEAMRYAYNAQSLALETAELVLPDGATTLWRTLETLSGGGDTHTVQITDENGVRQSYTYRRTSGSLRQAEDTFTLLSTTSPLAGTDAFEDKPVEYQWENGLLTAVKSRLLQNTVGRNSTTYAYTPNGQLIHTGGGFETIRIAYSPDPLTRAPVYYPQSIQFDTGAQIEYTYDAQNRLETVTDQHGAVYLYQWGEDGLPVQVLRQNDGIVWQYTYNAFGMVSEVRELASASDAPENAHVIIYTWNNFGELLAIDDSTMGAYELVYEVTPADDTVYYDTTIIDPTGTHSFYRQNTQRELLESRIDRADAVVPLRQTTYTYDTLGRLTAKQQWLYEEDGTSRSIDTTYTYTPLLEMPAVPGEDPAFSRVVNGTQMTITLPGGQTQVYIFDALGRIRQTKDEQNRIYRYHYTVNAGQAYGLRIVQVEISNNEITDTTAYDFDVRQQLRTIQRGDNTWTFLLDGDTTAVRFLQAPTVGIREMEWSRDSLGRVSDVTVRPLEIQLNSGNQTINTHLHVEYDFLGRQIVLNDDADRTIFITYCPTPFGGFARLESVPGSSTRPSCDAAREGYAQGTWYDSAGRLVRAVDEFGERRITYAADSAVHEWVVTTTFEPLAETGTIYQWEQHFSPVGDLLLWVDDTGTTHHYTYDTLGRLTTVNVDDAPEESFTLTYNDASLLIREEDGLGRGARYDYNRYGQLISKEDLSTRFVTSYDYGPNNLLRSVTSPLGNTTNYLYEDAIDPQLLTGIITASGSTNLYNWNLDANTFTYVDPRGYQQVYTFDTLGYLWRIDDALGRSHELHYDAIRHLTDWRQNQALNARAERHFTVDYSPAGDEITVSAANTDWRWRIGLSGQGYLNSLHNPANQPITFGYNALGQLASIGAGSRTWTLEREPGTRQMTYADGFGQQRELGYNASRNLVEVATQDGSVTYTYTPVEAQPAMAVQAQQPAEDLTYIFHAGNRADLTPPQVTLIRPGQAVTYGYNADGQLTDITQQQCLSTIGELTIDPEAPAACIQQTVGDDTLMLWQRNTRIMYDADGRPIRFVDEEQNVATFAYDENGNLLSYQNFNGQTYLYTYDAANRLTSITGPTGIKLLLAYSGIDSVTGICRTRADALNDYQECMAQGGEIESAVYDSLGRLITHQYPTLSNDGGSIQPAATQFEYASTGGGQLTRQNTPAGSVSYRYNDDGTGMLNELETNQVRHTAAYDNLDLLSQSDSATYTYDDLERIQRIDTGGHTLVYRYNEDGQGYCIEDKQSGTEICPQTDAQGMLQGITLQPAGREAAPLVQVTYPSLDATTQTINVLLEWMNGATLSLNLDRRGDTRFAFSSFGLLTSQRNFTPNGLEQTLLVDHYLAQTADGYSTVTGYDDMDNPVIVRVNARDGQMLYLATYAYSSDGQIAQETRRYANGTQMELTNTYVNNLLARQFIEVLEPVNGEALAIGTSALVLPGLLCLAAGRRRRRVYTLLSVFVVMTLLMTAAPPVINAQDTVRTTWAYRYYYDGVGNLTRIVLEDTNESCADFTYDSANHLIQASTTTVTQQYGYDIHDNLTTINSRTIVHNQPNSPLLAYEGSTPWFVGRTQTGATFFVTAGAQQPTWILNDGNAEPFGMVSDAASEPAAMWLFDPLGRTISEQSPVITDDLKRSACLAFVTPSSDSKDLTGAVPLVQGMVWDPALNLFFVDGRAYLPAMGRFVQRGVPDAAGDTYALNALPVQALHQRDYPTEQQGLSLLLDAWGNIMTVPYQGTAEAVRSRYLPSSTTQQPDFINTFEALDDAWYTQMQTLLALPDWMAENYNLRGIHADGPLLLQSSGSLPGQRQAASEQISSGLPVDMVHDLTLSLSIPSRLPLQSYQAFRTAPRPTLQDVWQAPMPDMALALEPTMMLNQIPQLMNNIGKNVHTLDLVNGLLALTERDGQVWIETLLDLALPAKPQVPYLNGQMWLEHWFNIQPLDLMQDVREQGIVPMAPLPSWYDIANSWSWLRSDMVQYGD